MLHDLRFGLRTLRRSRGFAAVSLLTLALGVGGATAIFSILNAVVLRPLPFPDSDQLVLIRDADLPKFSSFSVSPGRFLEWQARTRLFSGVAASQNDTVNLTGSGDPARLRGVDVSTNFFTVAGMPPLLGRIFTPADETGPANLVILSEGLWRGRFGGALDIVGRTILLDDQPTTVVGVMPGLFTLPSSAIELWMPWQITAQDRARYGSHYLVCLARMKPGVTLDAARADLARASTEIEHISDGDNVGWTTVMDQLQAYAVRNVRAGLWLLAGAVGVLLLIACVNIANLLIARGISRQREIAVRVALGAPRGRLIRQLVSENLMLGAAGSGAGLALAWAILRAIVASPSANLPRAQTIGLDPPTLGFALALAVLTPILFGLLPAFQMSRANLREALAAGGRSGSSGLRARTRGVLVVVEIALAVVLVAGSTLLVRSFMRLEAVSPGFDVDHRTVLSLSLPSGRYKTDDQREAFWYALLSQTAALPGVTAAATAQALPLVGDHVAGFTIPGRTPDDPSKWPSTNFYAVSPDYLRAMGIPLLRGRGIEATDTANTPQVVVISKNLADTYFGTTNPIGQKIRATQGPDRGYAEIVGVAGVIRQYGLDQPESMQVYAAAGQHAYFQSRLLVVDATAPADGVAVELRTVLRGIDPALPLATPRAYSDVLDASIGSRRLTTTLLGGFAVVALLLAAVGVYGLVAFAIRQRVQEIGIRLALGATRGNVLGLVLRQGLGLVAAGVAAGLVAAFWASRLLDTQLFEVSSHDPVAFGLAPLVLFVAATIAILVPARSAIRVSPIAALREP